MKAPKILTSTLVLALTVLPMTAFAQMDAPTSPSSSRPGAARPGFYIGLDVGGAAFSLDDNVEERFEELDLDLGSTANGGGLFFGYSWSNSFALELQLNGGTVATGDTDIEAGLADFMIAVRAPLMPQARVSPYMEGHVGGAVVAFSGDGIEDRAVLGGATGIGGGVEFHLSRRFAIDFGYRFSMINFEQEVIDTASGDEEIDIDGSGHMHRWSVRTTFSF